MRSLPEGWIGHAGAGTVALFGAQRQVQFEHIEMCLLHDTSYSWTSRVGFITDLQFQMTFQGILGHEGFLAKWAVTFNSYYDSSRSSRLTTDDAYDSSA